MKNKKGKKNNKNNIMRFVLVFTMMICLVVSMSTYWVYAYHHKKEYSFDNESKITYYKVSDYTYIDGNVVYLKNIDETINNTFVRNQNTILNKGSIVDTDFIIGIYNNILSIKINYILNTGELNFEEVLTLNVDLDTNMVCDNDRILKLVNGNYKSIATDIFDEYIKLPDSDISFVYDKITGEKFSYLEFNNQREKYIIRIREKLPDIMDIYIDNNKVYYVVRISEVSSVCYDINKDVVINREIGKI